MQFNFLTRGFTVPERKSCFCPLYISMCTNCTMYTAVHCIVTCTTQYLISACNSVTHTIQCSLFSVHYQLYSAPNPVIQLTILTDGVESLLQLVLGPVLHLVLDVPEEAHVCSVGGAALHRSLLSTGPGSTIIALYSSSSS